MKKNVMFYCIYIAFLLFILMAVMLGFIHQDIAFFIYLGIGLLIIWFLCSPGFNITGSMSGYLPPDPNAIIAAKKNTKVYLSLAFILNIPIIILLILMYFM